MTAKKQLSASDIIKECTELQSFWKPRHTEFQEMYDLLNLVDKLKSGPMETRVANEPLTFFNMSMHILTPNPMIHKISTYSLAKPEITKTSEIEGFLQDTVWPTIDENYRSRGKQSFYRELMAPMLIFGWYAVFRMVDEDRLIAEVWNPTQVFPKFTDEGMTACSRIVPITKESARRLVNQNIPNGWNQIIITSDTKMFDYWVINEEGVVENGIVIGTQLAKPMTPDPQWNGVIPILCGPVNGLPMFDRGDRSSDWKRSVGRGIFATNKREYFDFNKELTFRQQLLRDTSQPKYWERVAGANKNILTSEKLSKYGSIFTLSAQEEVGIMPMHPLPAEMTSSIFGTEARLQRGSLPWMLFGNISEQLSSYTMSQVAAAANQVLSAYHDAYMKVVSDIDNHWVNGIRSQHLKPYGFEMPKDITADIKVIAQYKLFIPGDVVQRATTLRMMSPNAELSPESTLDMLFPEVGDPVREMAKVNRAKAMMHPIAQSIYLISAYRQEAEDLLATYPDDPNSKASAALYNSVADSLEAQITQQPQQENAEGGQNAGTAPNQLQLPPA